MTLPYDQSKDSSPKRANSPDKRHGNTSPNAKPSVTMDREKHGSVLPDDEAYSATQADKTFEGWRGTPVEDRSRTSSVTYAEKLKRAASPQSQASRIPSQSHSSAGNKQASPIRTKSGSQNTKQVVYSKEDEDYSAAQADTQMPGWRDKSVGDSLDTRDAATSPSHPYCSSSSTSSGKDKSSFAQILITLGAIVAIGAVAIRYLKTSNILGN